MPIKNKLGYNPITKENKMWKIVAVVLLVALATFMIAGRIQAQIEHDKFMKQMDYLEAKYHI
jgi:hypothetical protein